MTSTTDPTRYLIPPLRHFAALSVAAILLAAVAGSADDWPRWRGPGYDGISKEKNWLKTWPATGPKQLWKASVGIGYSSMSVSQGKVLTMGNTEQQTDWVYCLDALSGKEVWRHSYPCSPKDPNGYHGPRCTPTVDGNRVYSLSRHGHLFCLDLASGKVLWSKDFSKDYGASPPTWGFAGSPLVKGDLLITEVGGSGSSVIAFDKATGKEAWRAGDDAVSYSSIVPLVVGGQESLAVFSAKGVVGRSPKDGAEQWRYAWKTSYDVHAATPVVSGDKVFISSGYGSGCALVQVQVGAGEPKELWRNKSMRNHVCSCVLWEGHLYGFDEGQLKCLDFQTGEEKWGEKSYGKGSITLGGDKFIVYSDKGRVGVVEPSPAGFKELTSFQVLTGKDTWAVPVLANGKLYCRSQEALVCLDLAAP